jgi:hypothetical protein
MAQVEPAGSEKVMSFTTVSQGGSVSVCDGSFHVTCVS